VLRRARDTANIFRVDFDQTLDWAVT
jgi:hypothetical protein